MNSAARLLPSPLRSGKGGPRRRGADDLGQWFDRLARSQRAITDASDQDVVAVTCREVRLLLGADVVVVATCQGDEIVVRAVEGMDADLVGTVIPKGSTLISLALRTGTSQLCVDGLADPRTDPEVNAAAGLRSSVIAPLVQRGRPVGVIQAMSSRPGAFDATDLALLELLAAGAAGRLELALASSEQVSMRDALAAQSRLLRTVFDALDAGIVLQEAPGGEIVLSNAAAERILGYSRNQLQARTPSASLWDVIRPDGSPWPRATQPQMVTLRTGEPQLGQLLGLRQPDGSVRWLTVTCLPVLDPEAPGVPNVVTTFTDVTAERQAAEAAAEAGRQLATAQQLTGLAWWEYDVAADTHRWSDPLWGMLGLSPDDVSAHFDSFRDCVHPEDLRHPAFRDAQAMVSWAERRGSGGVTDVFRVVHSDGTVRHLQTWVEQHRTADGRVGRVFGAMLDVTDREQAATEAQSQDRRFRVAFDGAPIGMAMSDLRPGSGGPLLRANDEFVRMLGGTQQQVMSMTAEDWRHPDDTAEDMERARSLWDGRVSSVSFHKRFRHADGHTVHAWIFSAVATDADDNPLYVISHVLDVTEREQAAAALARSQATIARSERQFRAVFDHAPIGMTLISLAPRDAGSVLLANDEFQRMLGYDKDELLTLGISTWTHPTDRDRDLDMLDRLVRGEVREASFEKRCLHKDGHTVNVWLHTATVSDESGTPLYLVSHSLDVTERMEHQRELERLVLTDTLTGLGNRTLLEDRVRHALSGIERETGNVVMLLLDLDRFKLVNDSLGHQAGDALLIEVARRLRAVTRKGTTLARLGGDEFAVLLDHARTPSHTTAVALRILEALREPFVLPTGESLVTTVSIGITSASNSAADTAELLREADLALYRAKDAGRDRVAYFDAELRSRAVARLDVEQRLRRGLANDGLRLHLQPVVSLPGGNPALGEALVRLEDPEIGLVPPLDFIQVAEDTGLIVDVDLWVMERAIALLAAPGCPVPRIAVNVSGRTLEHPSLLRRLRDALARWDVDGSRLLVELTESILLEGSGQVSETLTALHDLGVTVGIDDFGTGYSALAYLQRFDLDFLKIDRSFVAQLGHGPQPVAVVAAIIDLAHAHQLTVTAEGVETQEQADALRGMGCDHGQGWLFGRPTPTQLEVPAAPDRPLPRRAHS